MTTNELREAAQRALAFELDEWIKATGAIPRGGSWHAEILSMLERAALTATTNEAAAQPITTVMGLPVYEAAAQADGKWEGAEGWEPLAWALCAEEHGEEACEQLIWEGGPIPEPWGDRWLKYEPEAKRLIELVRKHAPAIATQPVQAQQGQALAWIDQETLDCLTRNTHGALAYHRWLSVGSPDEFRGRTIPIYAGHAPAVGLSEAVQTVLKSFDEAMESTEYSASHPLMIRWLNEANALRAALAASAPSHAEPQWVALPFASPMELWNAFRKGAQFVLHYHGKTLKVERMEPREHVVYVQPPVMPVKVYPDGRNCESAGDAIWLEQVDTSSGFMAQAIKNDPSATAIVVTPSQGEPQSTYSTSNGIRCDKCQEALSSHRDQRYCQEPSQTDDPIALWAETSYLRAGSCQARGEATCWACNGSGVVPGREQDGSGIGDSTPIAPPAGRTLTYGEIVKIANETHGGMSEMWVRDPDRAVVDIVRAVIAASSTTAGERG